MNRKDKKRKTQGESNSLMNPRRGALLYPADPLLLHYARNRCPVDVGQPWTKDEILMEVERETYNFALAPEAINMMHSEVEEKLRDGFAEIVYLDEIKHLLGTLE